MEKINQFLRSALGLERRALLAYRKSDASEFNGLLDELHAMSASPAIAFGFTKRTAAHTAFEQEMFGQMQFEVHERHLYKISAYNLGDEKMAFACLVSAQNPPCEIQTIGNCFWISSQNGEMKFSGLLSFGNSDLLESSWSFSGGDEELQFDRLGAPVDEVKYLAPRDDAASMSFF